MNIEGRIVLSSESYRVQQHGIIRINVPNVLLLLAWGYDSSSDVLAEYIDNEQDAQASKVWVVHTGQAIEIIGNGNGMVPEMDPEDAESLTLLLDAGESGEIVIGEEGFRLNDWIKHQISFHSLEFMMRSVALSWKAFDQSIDLGDEPGEKKLGLKGVGALAFRQIADRLTLYSKPIHRLACEWRPEILPQDIRVHKVEPPTEEGLRAQRSDYDIAEHDELLLDPYGKELDSGTRVVITNLHQGTEISLRPSILKEHFQRRYGPRIKSGSLALTIIDRRPSTLRDHPEGVEIEVHPPERHGTPVYTERTLYARGSEYPFQVEIFHSWGSTGECPSIRWRGVDRDLMSVFGEEGLDSSIWGAGSFFGYVGWPEGIPEGVAPWNPTKTRPVSSSYFADWIQAVKALERGLKDELGRAEDQKKQSEIQKFARDVQESFKESVSVIENLSEFLQRAEPNRRRRSPATGTTRGPWKDRVAASVWSEYGRPVGGVFLELWAGNTRLERKETKATGSVTFGKRRPGRYTIRIHTPPTMTCRGPDTQEVEVTPERPAARVLFRVIMGRPEVDQGNDDRGLADFVGFEIVLEPFEEDVDLPYDAMRLATGGLFKINTEAPDFRIAAEAGNWDLCGVLVSHYIAGNVASHLLPGTSPEFRAMRDSALMVNLLEGLRKRTRRRR